MSFRRRQRGKDAGKTTSSHTSWFPHATSKILPAGAHGITKNPDPSVQTEDRAKPSPGVAVPEDIGAGVRF